MSTGVEAGGEPRIDGEALLAELAELARFGASEGDGIDRPVFSPAYEQARAWLGGKMTAAGMTVRDDEAGNLVGRIGPDGPAVLCGSHVDTVSRGGPLDGALGVLAGLECARAIAAAGTELRAGFEVVAFADEEGRYLSYLGSLAMLGELPASLPEPLQAAMREAGFDPALAARAARPAEEILAYLELHIEQGPLLDAAGVPIGIVDAIVGLSQADLVFHGRADHAGTTPIPARHDAFLSACHFVIAANELVLAEGSEAVRLNFPLVESEPGAIGGVPSRVRLHKELRERDPEGLGRIDRRLEELAREVGARFGVEVSWEEVGLAPPVAMSERLRTVIREVCERREATSQPITSGAGHDAQVIGRRVESAMIFVPSAGGRSHRPDEHTDPEHVVLGAEVLLETVLELAA